MKAVLGFLGVAVVAILNLYVAVPVGYGFKLSAETIAIAALVGSVGGTVAMVYAGGWIWPRLRSAIRRVTGRKEEPPADEPEEQAPPGRTARIAERFGAPGFGIVAPLTIGGFAGAVSGVAMGIPKGRLALWLGLGQALVVIGYSLLVDATVA